MSDLIPLPSLPLPELTVLWRGEAEEILASLLKASGAALHSALASVTFPCISRSFPSVFVETNNDTFLYSIPPSCFSSCPFGVGDSSVLWVRARQAAWMD